MRAITTVSLFLLASHHYGGIVQALRIQVPGNKPANDLLREISFLRRRYEQAEGILALSISPSSSQDGKYESRTCLATP